MVLQNKPNKTEKEMPAVEIATEAVEEKVEAVEMAPEAVVEKAVEQVAPEKEKPAPVAPAPAVVQPAPEQVAEKSEDLIQVEKILAEGLENLYKDLPENRKQEFKTKGEETARQVADLLKAVKVQINKIVRLIVDWLKMIPGVNKFFLEQDAKIKADKLLELKKEKEGTWEVK